MHIANMHEYIGNTVQNKYIYKAPPSNTTITCGYFTLQTALEFLSCAHVITSGTLSPYTINNKLSKLCAEYRLYINSLNLLELERVTDTQKIYECVKQHLIKCFGFYFDADETVKKINAMKL